MNSYFEFSMAVRGLIIFDKNEMNLNEKSTQLEKNDIFCFKIFNVVFFTSNSLIQLLK